ncbi:MAG: OmpH family outer membrane protein [Bacteroidia bacterium]|nr:OmpH family outer membrane protein [Bacteroidia bacterium]NNF31910.1 OmpH family outer membrane protein [Flavobacteriaceae bacterium]MBT8277025.1 OmpH family outer membrane protein [Bacteroidia bacterium]NNJ81928.1 OmpH family outer membrane protein [Flavobacteriaceae bacterium]NNK53598.1 OmpH family outer membrane protein [Flavobacteriaceae bacterium]
MKTIQILLLFISFTVSAQTAQTKVGTIDIDFVLSQMPEITNVQNAVEAYGKTLDADLSTKVEGYQKLVEEYTKNDVTYTINQRKTMQDSIINSETDINKYRQNATQLITIKRDEELAPLYKKIGESLEKVAKSQGYTQVMERNSNLVYIDNNFDLTIAVLKDMGIEVKEKE